MGLWVELHCDVRSEGLRSSDFTMRCDAMSGRNYPSAMFGSGADGRRVVARVKALAREHGFTKLKDGRWCCPGCKETTP